MRSVIWTDEEGLRHRSLLLDTDPDEYAPQGILQDPPNVEELDWNLIKRTLHNLLVDRELFSTDDIRRNELQAVVNAALARPLKQLYRQKRDQQTRD